MEMNLQLHHVVSDITGATGMRIIRAIVAGERNSRRVGDLPRCALIPAIRDSIETIRTSPHSGQRSGRTCRSR